MNTVEAFGLVNKRVATKRIKNVTPHTELSPDNPQIELKTRLLFKAAVRGGHDAKIMQCAVGHPWDIPSDQVLKQVQLVVPA